MTGFGGLSEKQARSIAEANGRLNIWHGAVRSGKTISSLIKCAMFVAARKQRGGQFVVSGKTLETIKRNVFGPLEDPAIMGVDSRLSHYTAGAATGTILGREVAVISGNDARAEERLRGATTWGFYADEVSLLPESFVDQLIARASMPGAQGFMTTNPGAKNHWFKLRYIDQAWQRTGVDIRAWHFTLDDNPFLDPEYVLTLKAIYAGMWYKRMVLGLWVMAEGAIYDGWNDDLMIVNELPTIEEYLALGIDYGTTNPFSAILVGVGRDHTGTARLYLCDEYRYDSRAQGGRQLTDLQYSEAVRTWLANYPLAPGQRGVQPRYVFVDPSAASFRLQLHRDQLTNWPGDNEVVSGIRTMASLISGDKLRVHSRCKGFIGEVGGYSWDPDQAKKGLDVPVKADDHSCDAARYAVRTSEIFWHQRIYPRGVPSLV